MQLQACHCQACLQLCHTFFHKLVVWFFGIDKNFKERVRLDWTEFGQDRISTLFGEFPDIFKKPSPWHSSSLTIPQKCCPTNNPNKWLLHVCESVNAYYIHYSSWYCSTKLSLWCWIISHLSGWGNQLFALFHPSLSDVIWALNWGREIAWDCRVVYCWLILV